MFGVIVSSLGHLYCCVVLILSAWLGEKLESLVRGWVDLVRWVTGIPYGKDRPKYPLQTERIEPSYLEKDILDEASMLSKSSFPINPQDLVEKTKEVIRTKFACEKPSLLADDFLFVFPVVGPLRKQEFIDAFSSFKLEEAFSQGSGNFFNFSVDPLEPNRVWFFSRSELTHDGTLMFGPQKMKPTNRVVVSPPQVLSLTFNRSGECTKMTGGYPVDRTVGNTGGLGGVFGLIHAVGGSLPFPEGKPWVPSLRWEVFTHHFPALAKLGKK